MSDLTEEVQEIVAAVVPSKAIYSIDASFGGRLAIRRQGRPTCEHPSMFTNDILGYLNERIDFNSMRHVVDDSNISHGLYMARSRIVYCINSFLMTHLGTKNNRLTTTYRWYNQFLVEHNFIKCDRFENDMLAIYKYVSTIADLDKEKIKAIIQLLDAVRQKYEKSEGWKI
jgi:hypothetical protein